MKKNKTSPALDAVLTDPWWTEVYAKLPPSPEDDDEETPACPWCGGETYALGKLGATLHVRCRACGMTAHETT